MESRQNSTSFNIYWVNQWRAQFVPDRFVSVATTNKNNIVVSNHLVIQVFILEMLIASTRFRIDLLAQVGFYLPVVTSSFCGKMTGEKSI